MSRPQPQRPQPVSEVQHRHHMRMLGIVGGREQRGPRDREGDHEVWRQYPPRVVAANDREAIASLGPGD